VLAQKAAGFWELTEISSIFGINVQSLSSSNPASSLSLSDELKNQLWATAIAIAYLNSKCSSTKEGWKLVEMKAKKFLKKTQIANNIETFDFLSPAQTLANSLN